MIVGNQHTRATSHVLRVMDGIAWLAQAGMFLMLGLLVTPSHLVKHFWEALAVALFLTFVARPLVVAVTLKPLRFPGREIAYISWVGLRGAVPIVLAVFPVMAGIPDSRLLFDVTFVVVLFSLLVQGATVLWAARLLKVEVPQNCRAARIEGSLDRPRNRAGAGRLPRRDAVAQHRHAARFAYRPARSAGTLRRAGAP